MDRRDDMGSTYRVSLAGRSYEFADLRTLMAKASPRRSGDELAGIAAESQEERVAAQICLADVELSRFLDEPLIAWELDDVTRLIHEQHDVEAFAPIRSMSVGELRDWLLAYETTTQTLRDVAWGLSARDGGRGQQDHGQPGPRARRQQVFERHGVPLDGRTAGPALGAAAAESPHRRRARDPGVGRRRPAARLRRRGDRHQPGARLASALSTAAGDARPADRPVRHPDAIVRPRARHHHAAVHRGRGAGRPRVPVDRWDGGDQSIVRRVARPARRGACGGGVVGARHGRIAGDVLRDRTGIVPVRGRCPRCRSADPRGSRLCGGSPVRPVPREHRRRASSARSTCSTASR